MQDQIDSITRNINYLSEGVSYISIKDFNVLKYKGYQDKSILKDLVSLRFYLLVLNNYKFYLESEGSEPEWDINIKDIIEKSYGLVVHYMGMSYQWSFNDN